MNCNSVVTPTETNHKMDFDADGEDVNATTFKQLVGSLRCLCNPTYGMCYAVLMVNKFISKPKWSHYQVVVRILRWYGILFPSGILDDVNLVCYSDLDWCEDRVNRRSTTEYMSMYLGAPIS